MAKAVGPRRDLGERYTCYSCSTKFYDLHRPTPTCPKCGADQREDPALKAAKPAPPPRRAPARPPRPRRPSRAVANDDDAEPRARRKTGDDDEFDDDFSDDGDDFDDDDDNDLDDEDLG